MGEETEWPTLTPHLAAESTEAGQDEAEAGFVQRRKDSFLKSKVAERQVDGTVLENLSVVADEGLDVGRLQIGDEGGADGNLQRLGDREEREEGRPEVVVGGPVRAAAAGGFALPFGNFLLRSDGSRLREDLKIIFRFQSLPKIVH